MDLTDDQLLRISLDAADHPEDLPAGWEKSLVEQARSTGRPPRHPSWDRAGGPISALDAFIVTASEFGALIDSLEPAAWEQVTRVERARVRDIVIHLVGVERYLLGQLGRAPVLAAPRREDHWPVTRTATTDLRGRQNREIATTWWRTALELIATCGELGAGHGIVYHHLGGSLSGFLVARTFEVWTHGDDVRQAVGLPLDLLDEDRLTLMVGELMENLPLGLALTGSAQPGCTARFELEGPGGGSFDVALAPGEPVREADVTIATSTIALCRLAANRLDVDELGGTVGGDLDLLPSVLAGVSAFAAD